MCCGKWQDFLIFYGWIEFVWCVYVYHIYHIFFTHSSVDGHLRCFNILIIVNNAAMNMEVQIPLQHSDFIAFW